MQQGNRHEAQYPESAAGAQAQGIILPGGNQLEAAGKDQTGGTGPYTGGSMSVSGNGDRVTINGKACHT